MEYKLYNGDCLEEMKKIADKSIDLIVTSPPYNKKFFCKQKRTNQIWDKFKIDYSTYADNLPIEEYEEWMINVINTMLLKIKDNGSIFFNHKPIRHNNQIYHPLNFILKSNAKIYQEIIWDRKNSPNIRNDILVPCTERIYWLTKSKPYVNRKNLDKKYYSEVWEIIAEKQKNHPAPFPLQLPENCIKLASQENGIVLDPFMGSGTVGIACQNTNRNFIGIELDDKYFEIAKERMEKNVVRSE